MANVSMHTKKWERMRTKYKNSLWHLCYDVLDFKDIDNNFHRKALEDFQDWKRNGFDTLIFWPRGHLKSSLLTIGDSLQEIINDPSIRIMIMNATLPNARQWVTAIGNYILFSEKFRFFFPEIKPYEDSRAKWNREEIRIDRGGVTSREIPEPTLKGYGADSNITSQHFDIHKYDDLQNWENAQTPEQIINVYKKYQASLSVLEPDGRKDIIGTRYGAGDIYSYMLKMDTFKCSSRQLKEDNGSGKEVYIFPQKFNKKVEKKLKEELALEGNEFHFYCQYYNKIIHDSSKPFQESQILHYEALPPNGVYYITIDPASSTKSHADKSAIVSCYWVGACQRYIEGAIFLHKYIHDRLTLAALLEHMFGMYTEIRPELMSVEIAGAQSHTLWERIIEEDDRRNIKASLHRYQPKPSESKHSRIMSMQPMFKRGKFYIREEHVDFKDQLLSYTGIKKHEKDDLIDAVAQQLQIGQFPPGANDEDEEYDRDGYKPLFGSTGY